MTDDKHKADQDTIRKKIAGAAKVHRRHAVLHQTYKVIALNSLAIDIEWDTRI